MDTWLITTQRINFRHILDELTRMGINRHEASRRINKPYTTLTRWYEGSEPSFEGGASLLTLYLVCKQQSRPNSLCKCHKHELANND